MKILRLRSKLAKKEIAERCIKLGCLPFSPSIVHSEEQINLALFLAKRSFKNKTSIAKTLELEMLLWLCGEREIKKALEKSDFSPEDFILVCLRRPCSPVDFDSGEKPLDLKKEASELELEKISLSRI